MHPRASAEPARLAGLAAAVVLLAAAELLIGASVSLAAGYPRAEAQIFLAARPWLLLLLALIVRRCHLVGRVALFGLFLVAACAAEGLYLLRLGNAAPWPELLRGAAAAAMAIALLDAAFSYVHRALGRPGLAAVVLASAVLLAAPAVRNGWRTAATAVETPRPASRKPDLLLMTALPIGWGEGGAFDPASRPAAAYRLLQEEFSVRPIDTLEPASLDGRLLLLAQPRWLAPAELVALDEWVRAGGRALILTDPLLEWPSELPLGDVRRAPPVGLLGPLLDHWGLGIAGRQADAGGLEDGRRLVLRQAGHLVTSGPACRIVRDYRAECRIGRGVATVIADADLLRDDLWMGGGADGGAREHRRADNPLILADWLDDLAGISRNRARGRVIWAEPGSRPLDAARIVAGGLLLLAAAFAVAALLLRRRAG
ncbi:hypothetical protein E2493_12095 [Sphingomonas parva]|uniref:ABC transporter n=1 Tax=Sphingomonas parva TaxID=2555898 RepID=A0A4Y8ZPJ2_9SPHN|nr:hypothetical protein [Sphingomonas parva]TFI57931.1 hypothetical protein E2493_12095 [Sphingomonas parva]